MANETSATILSDIDSLAWEFFKLISRIEYSLKASGMHKGEGNAEPNWQMFSYEIEELITNPPTQELKSAIRFILENPPKKQMVINNQVHFSNVIPNTASQSDMLLQYVRRVRNNLFHGSKFNVDWFDRERSRSLMESSLIILQYSINAVPAVLNEFNASRYS